MINETAIYLIREFIPTKEPIDVHMVPGDASAAELLKATEDLSWVGSDRQITLRVISGKHLKTLVDKIQAISLPQAKESS